MTQLKVCWAGTFAPSFGRNRRLEQYLAASPVDVTVIREDLWPEDRIAAVVTGRIAIALRMLLIYPKLLFRMLRAPAPDVYLVSYPGWFDVPIVKLTAMIKRRTVVFDVFISLWDTAVTDRRLIAPKSLTARAARGIDRWSIRMSDHALADCPAHARFLAGLADVPVDRFGVVYLGADENTFRPLGPSNAEAEVLFYGTFVPLQGVEWIVRAAKLLEDTGVTFRFVGDGQSKAAAVRLAAELDASNVEFVGLLPQDQLVSEIENASLLLGVFGRTPKADRVIPHKLFESLACRRPMLTSASTAVTEVFNPSEVAVCEPGDAVAIAQAIVGLLGDQAGLGRLAREGCNRFIEDFAQEPQARRMLRELTATAERAWRTSVRPAT